MKKTLLQVLKVFVLAITITLFLCVGAISYTINKSWPQENGTLKIAGLKDKVEVLRDTSGVPHIYASNQHDLFLTQGYIHAQDRFWQMDVWRHIGSGRLAEMFGPSQVDKDKFIRTLGWNRVSQQEVDNLDEEMRGFLQAYSQGINSYLQGKSGNNISLEYAVLNLLNRDYKPEPWQPLHTVTWGKVMAWDLGGNMDTEIEHSVLLKTLSTQQVEELFPPYSPEKPVIVANSKSSAELIKTESAENPELARAIFPALESLQPSLNSLQDILSPRESSIGSNNWVISGKRTNTGLPVLANDPHLAVQMPSIWYEVGLHCTQINSDCPYDVTGFSFPGMLGVILGHNNRIAWGVTNVNPDVMDLYVEKINPDNPNQYEFEGKWVDMQLVEETIAIAGNQPITQTVRYTRHGPIISETYGLLKDVQPKYNIKLPEKYAIALRWTALEPSRLLYAIPQINRAQNWQEFRQAVKNFEVPSQNFVYADVEGNIGYQMPGKVPIRKNGNGSYPVAGWTDKFEWQGYIPFEKLPSVFNPEQGYIATANNAVVGSNFPYLITTEWDYGYRAQRIVEMIESKQSGISLEDIQAIQGDNKNLNAVELVPILLQVDLKNKHLESVRDILRGWDFQESSDNSAGAIYQAFWKHLLAATFNDQLPEKYWLEGEDRAFAIVSNLLAKPNSDWWDDQTTPEVETRDAVFVRAFANAVQDLEANLGKNPQRWRWGDLHTVTFRNQTLGKSGIGMIEELFNRGPFPTSGGSSIVNATAWNAAKSYEVTWVPSMRMILDLSNFENSVSINCTGQSGHAFHRHYDDMIEPWSQIKYHHILWQKDVVAAKSISQLNLVPD